MPLYQPSKQEIDHAIESAASLAPSLWSRLVHAGCLLRAADLAWTADGWACHSVHEPGGYALDFAACACPDCRERRAEVGGEPFCSHRLALLVYCDVCLAHLRRRLLGPTTDPAARTAARQAANAGLLLMRYDGGRRLALFAHLDPRRPLPNAVCQLVKLGGKIGFASERDLAAFAAWLDQAQPLEPPATDGAHGASRSGASLGRLVCAMAVQPTASIFRTLSCAALA